jgi:hypothetical protein
MLLAMGFESACDMELLNEVLNAIFKLVGFGGGFLALLLTVLRRRNVEDIR